MNFSYIIKQFDARVMSFYSDTRFNAVQKNNWEAGVGLQLQISKIVQHNANKRCQFGWQSMQSWRI